MPRRIKIRIFPDGRIEAETEGIKGHACTPYIQVLEELLQAEVVSSAYTREFLEKEVEAETVAGSSDEQEVKDKNTTLTEFGPAVEEKQGLTNGPRNAPDR